MEMTGDWLRPVEGEKIVFEKLPTDTDFSITGVNEALRILGTSAAKVVVSISDVERLPDVMRGVRANLMGKVNENLPLGMWYVEWAGRRVGSRGA